MVAAVHHAYLRTALAGLPKLVEGVLLLKVWARQQGLGAAAAGGAADGLDGHLLTMMMAHLVVQGRVNVFTPPLQMLRAALQLLADPASGPAGRGFSMAGPGSETVSAAGFAGPGATPPALDVFRKQHEVVVVDPTGWVNLAARMSRSAAQHTAAAARQTLSLLDSPLDPGAAFQAVFLSRVSPAVSFDYHWRVALPLRWRPPAGKAGGAAGAVAGSKDGAAARSKERAAVEEEGEQACSLCCDQVVWRVQEAHVEGLVRQALGDRARLVRAVRRRLAGGQAPGTLARGLPLPQGGQELLLVAQLDPTLALRLADVGPPADDARASARFRAFWGDKSELRRFQDGKISEAVVWGVAAAARHTVPDRIVEYILHRHLPASSSLLSCSSGALDSVLLEYKRGLPAASRKGAGSRGQGHEGSEPLNPDSGVTACRLMEAALEKLSKQLRTLDSTALKVVGVQPISAVTRHTCPFFPLPHPLAGGPGAGEELPRCLEAVEVLVQLENSGKWPDHPEAFAKTKAALSLQLAAALEASLPGAHTSASEAALDVLLEGFAFRLTLYSGRDEVMMERAAAAHQAAAAAAAAGAPAGAAAPAAASVALLERSPLVRNWHHGLVSAVGGANPAFAPAARLAKRWVGAHLLSNHLCDEAVELLVAAAFSGPAVMSAPGSRITGFLRFLDLLSTQPWSQQPLVVDPERQLGQAQRRDILRQYNTRRGAKQAVPAMYIATPRDHGSSHWTSQRPSAEVTSHLVALAGRSGRLLRSLLESGRPPAAPSATSTVAKQAAPEVRQVAEEEFLAAFATPLDDFDVLLLLRGEALPQAGRAPPQHRLLLAQQRRAAAGGQQPDALSALEAEPAAPPAKRARVFLRAFPEQVVLSGKGPDKLVPELLVGFDPVSELLSRLEEQYGHMATFCADLHGGALLGIKWNPLAFMPAAAKATTYHTSLPCVLTGTGGTPSAADKSNGAAPGRRPGRAAAASCVPHVVSVLSEIRELGEGLVEGVMALDSGRRLGVSA